MQPYCHSVHLRLVLAVLLFCFLPPSPASYSEKESVNLQVRKIIRTWLLMPQVRNFELTCSVDIYLGQFFCPTCGSAVENLFFQSNDLMERIFPSKIGRVFLKTAITLGGLILLLDYSGLVKLPSLFAAVSLPQCCLHFLLTCAINVGRFLTSCVVCLTLI